MVLDLSQPQELWQTYQTLYDALAKRIKQCIGDASKQNPGIKDKLRESIFRRIGNAVSRRIFNGNDSISLPLSVEKRRCRTITNSILYHRIEIR